MTKRFAWRIAAVALFTVPSASAHARCNAVKVQNGETYCLQSSDGEKNHPYPNSTTYVKTMGSIQVTTTRPGVQTTKTGTRVLMRSANDIRRERRWH